MKLKDKPRHTRVETHTDAPDPELDRLVDRELEVYYETTDLDERLQMGCERKPEYGGYFYKHNFSIQLNERTCKVISAVLFAGLGVGDDVAMLELLIQVVNRTQSSLVKDVSTRHYSLVGTLL